MLWLWMLVACDGGTKDEADTDTDTDTDTDADTDADTDTDTDVGDTDTAVPREDCPRDGRVLVNVNVTAAPAITAADQVTVNLFTTYPAPPTYYYVTPGTDFGSLPALASDNNVAAGTFANVVYCLDVDSDNLNNCEGPGDVLLEAPLMLVADTITNIDVDFSALTIGTPTAGMLPPDCP